MADGGGGPAYGSDVFGEFLGLGRHLLISGMVVVRACEELQPASRRARKKVSLIELKKKLCALLIISIEKKGGFLTF